MHKDIIETLHIFLVTNDAKLYIKIGKVILINNLIREKKELEGLNSFFCPRTSFKLWNLLM